APEPGRCDRLADVNRLRGCADRRIEAALAKLEMGCYELVPADPHLVAGRAPVAQRLGDRGAKLVVKLEREVFEGMVGDNPRIDEELTVQLLRVVTLAGDQVRSRRARESSPPPPRSGSARVVLLGCCNCKRARDVPPVDSLL